MRRFVLRRLLFAGFTLWLITVVVFTLSHMGPDPLLVFIREGTYGLDQETIDALKQKWGFDRPVVVQYIVWLGNVARGDLGRSIASQRPVSKTIAEKAGATLQLGLAGWLLATGLGIPLGILSAVKRGTFWDYLGRFVALIGQATPSFWLALVVILIFAVQFDLLPSATRSVDGPFLTQIRHFILPTLVLGFDPLARYLRLTRSGMLEVLDMEYVKFARAKGVGNASVIWKHALRNALIQPLTTSALVLASFITGAVFVEEIFAWPGLGRLAVSATMENDFPLLQAVVLMFGVLYVVMNFVVDIAYAYVDPRIRYR